MESSPERLATICVGYRETFWMRRNASENNFAGSCLAINFFQPHVFGVRMSTEKKQAVNLSSECIALHNECF